MVCFEFCSKHQRQSLKELSVCAADRQDDDDDFVEDLVLSDLDKEELTASLYSGQINSATQVSMAMFLKGKQVRPASSQRPQLSR